MTIRTVNYLAAAFLLGFTAFAPAVMAQVNEEEEEMALDEDEDEEEEEEEEMAADDGDQDELECLLEILGDHEEKVKDLRICIEDSVTENGDTAEWPAITQDCSDEYENAKVGFNDLRSCFGD